MQGDSSALARWLDQERGQARVPQCSYLFHKWDRYPAGHRVSEHQHNFWQMEYVQEGHLRFKVNGLHYEVLPGSCIVVPQDYLHGIDYVASCNKALTIKFNVDGRFVEAGRPPALLYEEQHTHVLQALAQHMPSQDGEHGPSPQLPVVNALLGALVALAIDDPEVLATAFGGSALVTVIKRHVLRNNGRPLAVKELADRMQLSPSHLTQRFRQEAGMGLKTFIDEQRAVFAARELAFSDKSVGLIAEELGFSDSFAFSRFFRRVVEAAPSEFRKAAREQLQ